MIRCPVCLYPSPSGNPQVSSKIHDPQRDLHRFSCPRCGVFFSAPHGSSQSLDSENIVQSIRLTLSWAIRRATDENREPPTVIRSNFEELARGANPPEDVLEQTSVLLLTIASFTKTLGTWTRAEPYLTWAARLCLVDAERARNLGVALEQHALLNHPVETDISVKFSLTLAGWERVSELRKAAIKPDSAFVAMWFHDDLNGIYKAGFEAALTDCGYSPPFRIDHTPHTNRIDVEIVERIKRSSLIIADVTGDRGGVYYEAGLAQGIGIPVIWTCATWTAMLPAKGSIYPEMDTAPECIEVSWKKRIHFDTRQFHTLFWEDAADLRKQLNDRIVLLGLARKTPY